MWAPDYPGAAATQHLLFVAMGGSGTRAAGSSAFSRGRITPDCYLNCPDFGKTLQAKQNTSVGCMGPYGLPICDPWLTAASPARLAALGEQRPCVSTAPGPVAGTQEVLSKQAAGAQLFLVPVLGGGGDCSLERGAPGSSRQGGLVHAPQPYLPPPQCANLGVHGQLPQGLRTVLQ